MKKNGFVFVETIIVVVVLTVGMILIYSSFSSILNNSKRRTTFDDISYIYRTYYIQEFITSLNLEDYVQEYLIKPNSKMIEFSCDNTSLYKIDRNTTTQSEAVSMPVSEQIKQDFCKKIMLSLNVNKIYITKYDIVDLKKCTTSGGKLSSGCRESNKSVYDALNRLDSNTVFYLRTISVPQAEKAEENYRIIVMYSDLFTDKDKNIYRADNNGKCPDGYDKLEDNSCARVINRSYYSTIKVIKKSAS